jgi:ABC-2 type transport system permease protein
VSAVLSASSIAKRYGELEALTDISFEVRAGEIVAVLGPNGAGKTTLLSILARVQPPSSGALGGDARGVGWAPQQPALYSKLSVAENIELFARLERLPDPAAAVARMLDQTGLADRADELVGRLSGGNRQRVNVALGLMADPPVLALDEPSASLDPAQRERLWEFIAGLARGGTALRRSGARAHRWAAAVRRQPKRAAACRRRGARGRPRAGAGRVPRARPRTERRMRWMLRKDLLILRRSRLLVALLIVYPVAIALLIGFAISRSPSRPRVAIVDETPPGETVAVGSQRVPVSRYAEELFAQVDSVHASSRSQAIGQIKSGAVIAAVIIPSNIAARLSSAIEQAQLEVLYNGDALEQSLVQSTLNSALAEANRGFSQQIQRAAAKAIEALLQGGHSGILGAPEDLIGLGEIPTSLRAIIAREPRGHTRSELERIEAFAGFAAQNLTLAKRVLTTIGQPIAVKSTLLHGRRTPLNTFAVVVAVSVSLMFVCVLLAAGGVALEREERALGRLIRGPPALLSRSALLVEKTLLAAVCSFLLALAMLAGIGAFVSLDWGRVGLWLAALALGALAFGALGVAIGALAREVRAASLLAFLLSLPVAFLALVPSGAVSGAFNDAIGVVSFLFPFKAALQALDAAVNGAAPSIGGSLLHLAGLAALFGLLARAGLRHAD